LELPTKPTCSILVAPIVAVVVPVQEIALNVMRKLVLHVIQVYHPLKEKYPAVTTSIGQHVFGNLIPPPNNPSFEASCTALVVLIAKYGWGGW
jgi:hypothetical protein